MDVRVRLGINTGFAINRFPRPEDWVGVVADELGLDTVQFTADLLNPFLPEPLVRAQAETIRRLCDAKGIHIETTFTSAFTRVNHLMHPDAATRRVWVEWFKKFFQLSADLGAVGAGSHFGILSVRENDDSALRKARIQSAIDAWRELSDHATGLGLAYLLFEPMSVPRELGETIPETRRLLDRCEEGFPVPMKLCLDVDHGDVTSSDPQDTDPHAWIRAFGPESPVIHIKQSLTDKGGHYPFTAECNRTGRIVPEEILQTMREAGVQDCTLLLEISHRERLPMDGMVVSDLKESVAYWRPAIDAVAAETAAKGVQA
jgi:sugar phosphate isomerase/epimerase